MYKTPRIADFRDRITLLQVQWQVDDELNRKEVLVPVKTVWAAIEAKSSAFDGTQTGTRPEVVYKIFLRKIDVSFGYIQWKNKILSLKFPTYEVDNKYIYFEAVMIDGKEHILAGVS